MTKTVKILHQPARPRFEAHSKVPSRAVFRIDRQTARQRRRAFKSPNRIAKALFTTPPFSPLPPKKEAPVRETFHHPAPACLIIVICELIIIGEIVTFFFFPHPCLFLSRKKKQHKNRTYRYHFVIDPPPLASPLSSSPLPLA